MLVLLAAKPQAAKVKATVHGKCSVKIEKALSLYSKIIWEKKRDHTHISFITVYCYNCSILLSIIIVNLLLYLIHKLNFII